MRFKMQITRRLVFQFLLFTALTGIAKLADYYFENHRGTFKEFQTSNEEPEKEQGVVYLFSQTSNFNAKSPVQKLPIRKLIAQAHDKYLQKCHQLRNHQAFKTENKVPRTPFYLSCHNLIFRQNYFARPDDEPLAC